jgi:hypothetical protein
MRVRCATSRTDPYPLLADILPDCRPDVAASQLVRWFVVARSRSDIDRSTAANDLRPSASCSARKNPQWISANTPPVFPGLRPRIWPHLLRLVTKGNVGQAPCHLVSSSVEMKLALAQKEESQCRFHRGNSARIDHEGFYCNRGYAVATGVLATQSIDILFQVCLPSSWLCLPVSQCVCPVS